MNSLHFFWLILGTFNEHLNYNLTYVCIPLAYFYLQQRRIFVIEKLQQPFFNLDVKISSPCARSTGDFSFPDQIIRTRGNVAELSSTRSLSSATQGTYSEINCSKKLDRFFFHEKYCFCSIKKVELCGAVLIKFVSYPQDVLHDGRDGLRENPLHLQLHQSLAEHAKR